MVPRHDPDIGHVHRAERREALVNGALLSAGAIAVVDNIVAHWLLGLHRAMPGDAAPVVESALILLGLAAMAIGTWRESRARRTGAHES